MLNNDWHSIISPGYGWCGITSVAAGQHNIGPWWSVQYLCNITLIARYNQRRSRYESFEILIVFSYTYKLGINFFNGKLVNLQFSVSLVHSDLFIYLCHNNCNLFVCSKSFLIIYLLNNDWYPIISPVYGQCGTPM